MTAELPPDPDQRLEPAVLLSWAATGVAMTAVAAVLTAALPGVDGGWATLRVVALLVLALAAIVVGPALRYRNWRYAVREEEIDLRHGTWVVRRTIVPMARVQHVDTSRSALGQVLGIATLTIHTAAGAHSIPGIAAGNADLLRNGIARRARVPDDV